MDQTLQLFDTMDVRITVQNSFPTFVNGRQARRRFGGCGRHLQCQRHQSRRRAALQGLRRLNLMMIVVETLCLLLLVLQRPWLVRCACSRCVR